MAAYITTVLLLLISVHLVMRLCDINKELKLIRKELEKQNSEPL